MKLVKILVVLVVLAIVAVIALAFSLDALAASGVRRGGSYALGVDVDVESVDLDLGSRVHASLRDLEVDNPDGFEAADFLVLGSGSLDFASGDLLEDVITVPELLLSGIRISLERRAGATNYGVLLENLERLSGKGDAPADPEAGGGKRFRIDRILLTDVAATIDMLPAGGTATRFEVQIPSLEIEEVGTDMTTAQIFSVVVRALLEAVLQGGAGLPAELLEDLRGRLGALEDVAIQVQGGAAKVLQEGAQQVQEQVGEELKKVGDKANEALEGLGGVLKGKKQD